MTFLRAAAAALLVSLVLAAPAAAGPLSPGKLDLTFSGDGFLRSQFRLGSEVEGRQLVPLRSGKLAVLTAPSAVVRLRASGRLDTRFSRDGRVRWRDSDTAERMAEAPDRALVLAGRRRGDALAVRRLLPDGRADVRFGTRGKIVFETGAFLRGVDVVVGPDGTAYVAAIASSQGSGRLVVFALDPTGRLVPGFGEGGIAQLAYDVSGYAAHKLVRLADGRLRYVTDATLLSGRSVVALAGLTADGRPDAAVATTGVRHVSSPTARFLTGIELDASERLLLATRRAGEIVVDAVTADGRQVPGYGQGDVARIRLPFGFWAEAIAILDRGRVAVSATSARRPWRVAVTVLDRRGRRLKVFGGRRVAVVRFPGRRRVYLDQLELDHLGRLVLGGYSGDGLASIRDDFGSDYVALARVRLRGAALTLPSSAAVTRSGIASLRVRCRAATTCQAALSVTRGSLRRRDSIRVRSGAVRVVRMRLGATGARLAAQGRTVRLAATIVGGRRIEPAAVRVRLRRG